MERSSGGASFSSGPWPAAADYAGWSPLALHVGWITVRRSNLTIAVSTSMEPMCLTPFALNGNGDCGNASTPAI
jgi:hypothetical protein